MYRSHESRKAADTCGYFLHKLKTDSRVLDAGCGPGSVTASLATLIPDGSVIGVDAFETAITKARAQPSLPANCTFQVADLTALPFPNDRFDAIYTSQVLAHVPDTAAALAELRRVCKPGGFVALREGDFPAVMLHPALPALERWKTAMMAILRRSAGHPDAGRSLVGWALAAGFAEPGIEYSVGSIAYAGAQRQFWADTMAARVAGDATWREHAEASGLTEADFAEMKEGWAAWAADPAAVFAMPCGQIICKKE